MDSLPPGLRRSRGSGRRKSRGTETPSTLSCATATPLSASLAANPMSSNVRRRLIIRRRRLRSRKLSLTRADTPSDETSSAPKGEGRGAKALAAALTDHARRPARPIPVSTADADAFRADFEFQAAWGAHIEYLGCDGVD